MSSPIASKRLKTSASIPSPMGVPAQMPPNQPFIAPADPAFQPAIPTTPQNPQSPQNARKRKAPSHPTSPDMPLDYVPTPPEGITPVSANPAATETGSRKKGRTNTPWTPEEEHKLQVMRGENKGWSEIAKSFPSRTEGSVKKHWYKDMHYAEFSQDEASALRDAIREYDANKWKAIGQKVGKPAKACEHYAREHFKAS